MMLHFAYGSNMSRVLMRARCPGAMALGPATLPGWRLVLTADGYASVGPRPGAVVHGVLWRLGARDLAAINAYESLDSGLYRRRLLPVLRDGKRISALVYLGRGRGAGQPRPGYLELVVSAAREWQLPDAYIRSIQQWAPSGWRGARAKDTGEIG